MNHYGFQLSFCHPYCPNEKGNVENDVQWVKQKMKRCKQSNFESFMHLQQYVTELVEQANKQNIDLNKIHVTGYSNTKAPHFYQCRHVSFPTLKKRRGKYRDMRPFDSKEVNIVCLKCSNMKRLRSDKRNQPFESSLRTKQLQHSQGRTRKEDDTSKYGIICEH